MYAVLDSGTEDDVSVECNIGLLKKEFTITKYKSDVMRELKRILKYQINFSLKLKIRSPMSLT